MQLQVVQGYGGGTGWKPMWNVEVLKDGAWCLHDSFLNYHRAASYLNSLKNKENFRVRPRTWSMP